MKKKLLKIAILTLAIVMLAGIMAPAAAASWQATPGAPGSAAESLDGHQNWYWLTGGGARAIGWHNINGAWFNFRLNGVMQRAGDPAASDLYWAVAPQGQFSRFNLWVIDEDAGTAAFLPVVNRNVHGFFREQLAVGAWGESSHWQNMWEADDDGNIWITSMEVNTTGGEWGGLGRIFRANASGVMSTGWQAIVVEHEFHVGMTGNPATGLGPRHNIGGHWYYFGEDGVMRTNAWVDSNGTWFRLGGNGQMLRNQWATIDNIVYRFAGSGAMVTGWAHIGGATGHWYFFAENGARQSNRWVETNGAWYWLVEEDIVVDGVTIFPVGSMARNGIFNVGTVANPQWHAFDHAGVWLGQVGQPVIGPTSPWFSANP